MPKPRVPVAVPQRVVDAEQLVQEIKDLVDERDFYKKLLTEIAEHWFALPDSYRGSLRHDLEETLDIAVSVCIPSEEFVERT